jgi:AcrR family transcriptional regulator
MTNMFVTNKFVTALFVANVFVTVAGVTSRRERPAKPALTRDGIVRLAVGLMRAEGLARVTMRRLAGELDTGPASLYVYVRNTDDLHAAVLDEVLGETDLSGGDGDWEDRLVAVLVSYTGVLFRHPELARTALLTHPSGPHAMALVDRLLGLLAEGGLPVDRAAWLVDLLLQRGAATAAEHAPPGDDRAMDALRAAIAAAAPDRHPHLAAASEDLLGGTGRERLDWGYRVLINGAAATPRH